MNAGVFIGLLIVLIALVAIASSFFAISAAKRKRDQQNRDNTPNMLDGTRSIKSRHTSGADSL